MRRGDKWKRLHFEMLEERAYLSASPDGFFAQVRLEVTDLGGNPVHAVAPGEQFQVRAIVRDLREGEIFYGVFGGFVGLDYDPALANLIGQDYGELYPTIQHTYASEPGHVLGAGAYSASLSPLGRGEQVLWSMTFEARAAGPLALNLVADNALGHEFLEYGYNESVRNDQIRFISTVIDIAADPNRSDPMPAMPLPANATIVTPEVWATYLPQPQGQPTADKTAPQDPTSTSQDNSVPPETTSSGTPPTDTPPPADSGNHPTDGYLAEVRLYITDLDGNTIDSVVAGQQFKVRALIRDLREGANFAGVYAAYLGLEYDPSLANLVGREFGSDYQNGTASWGMEAGHIVSIGAFSAALNGLGTSEDLFWTMTFAARTAGNLNFGLSIDHTVGHEFLEYGLNQELGDGQIHLVGATVNAVSSAGQTDPLPALPLPESFIAPPPDRQTHIPVDITLPVPAVSTPAIDPPSAASDPPPETPTEDPTTDPPSQTASNPPGGEFTFPIISPTVWQKIIDKLGDKLPEAYRTPNNFIALWDPSPQGVIANQQAIQDFIARFPETKDLFVEPVNTWSYASQPYQIACDFPVTGTAEIANDLPTADSFRELINVRGMSDIEMSGAAAQAQQSNAIPTSPPTIRATAEAAPFTEHATLAARTEDASSSNAANSMTAARPAKPSSDSPDAETEPGEAAQPLDAKLPAAL